MNTNFAACVILYNPKKDDIANIATYSNKVKKLYVFDNTEGTNNAAFFKGIYNVSYFYDNENKGLSFRLNEACNKAIADNFEFLLTMDQDSSFLDENLDQYLNDVLHYPNKEKVAVYGLEYENEHKKFIPNKIIPSKKDHLITSASIINLKLFTTIGGFDENLFIDGVDIDYCYNAMAKGFENIEFKNNYFKHALGEPIFRGTIYTLFLFKKKRTIHSPIRIYYMYRNMLYLENKYKDIFPELIVNLNRRYLYMIRKSIKYSINIFEAIKYKYKAKSDFKNNKMGKYIE